MLCLRKYSPAASVFQPPSRLDLNMFWRCMMEESYYLAIHVNTTFRGLAQSLTTESPGRLQLIAIEVDLLQLELGLTPAKKALAISRFLQGIAKKHNRYW